jgi:hypothetical protein
MDGFSPHAPRLLRFNTGATISIGDSTHRWPFMKIYGADNREMMNITALEREGDQLVIRGKIFGAMPLTAKLRPEEARAAFKLLNFRTVLFLLTFVFRRKSS